ncbi:nischarin [Plakobranchus ocellatus]|uniref:Nischarin n=1 Tax=Plakobranchus ocellatus TaxID=259542 RepID=A0AAV3YMN4_9GAST|nr:nischarin [Plakobranchus ocellatus]
MYGGQDSGYEDEPQCELHTLCKTGTLGNILAWLQGNGEDVDWYYEGETPLQAVVQSGREDAADVISVLVDYGCDVNAQNIAEGNTALHLNVLYGNFPRDFDTIVALRSKNCDLGVRNKALRTAYDVAIANGEFELAGTLDGTVPVENAKEHYTRMMGQKYGPYIIEAVLNSDDISLQKYILLGGDPNYLNKYGNGAIHYAVTHSNLSVYDTLSVLLSASANCNLKNEEGDTALNLCIKSDSLRSKGQMARCVQLLVDAGAESNIQDLDGRDACRIAEDKGYDDILQILMAKDLSSSSDSDVFDGLALEELPPIPEEENEPEVEPVTPRIDVNAPNADGLCPIHVATKLTNETQRHKRITELLDEGAEISKTIVASGNTSLHLCAERDYGETAKLLLEHHIDYTVKNNEGKTAYDLAQELHHQTVMDAIDEKRGTVQEQWRKAGRKAKWCTIL